MPDITLLCGSLLSQVFLKLEVALGKSRQTVQKRNKVHTETLDDNGADILHFNAVKPTKSLFHNQDYSWQTNAHV